MIHYKIICRIIGTLLVIESLILLLCSLFPLLLKENDFFGFLASSLITACAGTAFLVYGKGTKNEISRRDAYVVVTVIWIIFSLFGALPYFISGYISSFTDAFFETMSGFTTTGATILNDIELLPHGLLFWRSLTQWIGGLGIVFFTVAVLPIFGLDDVQLFAAESTAPTHGKTHPRISVSGRWILVIYMVLTICCTVSLKLCGMNFFDSVSHTFCVISTGGYSTKNSSIAFFASHSIENAITTFMFLSGVNYSLLYFMLFKGKLKRMYRDTEFNWYFWVTITFIFIIAIGLIVKGSESPVDSLRHSAFQVVSILTTTGFTTTNYMAWPTLLWMILGLCMYPGACAGSSTGAMKNVRIVILFKTMRNEFSRILHPNAILPVRISGKVIPSSTKQSVLAFTIFYFGIILFSWLLFIALGLDLTTAYGSAISYIGNVGVTIGGNGNMNSCYMLPVAGKWFASMLMLVGRLEIFPVLLLLTPSFWKSR
ncbi:MAG TPA: TrkH family potassium uptake protein [Bacteroidaceae bacterium]|nr:TrkH family potassium uptake protein [Bacteroidaceae bacterium]